MVQGLGLSAFTVRAQIQFLVRELKSHKPHHVAERRILWEFLRDYLNDLIVL